MPDRLDEPATPTSPATTLEWALYYAARGWSVVPVRPGEKMPAIPWARHQSSPADAGLIRTWLDDPAMGLGLVQGRHVGTIVLDFDGEAGLATLEELERRGLPISTRQFTPRGGVHVLLTHPGRHVPTRKNVLPGMDVRGDGGFIVCCPSLGANGRPYAWDADAHPQEAPLADLPDWLAETVCGPVAGGTDLPGQVIRAPAASVTGFEFGRELVADGRETYMRNTILAVLRDLRDRLGRLPDEAELVAEAWPQYQRHVDLTRPGRGLAEFTAKARYTLARVAQGAVNGLSADAPPPPQMEGAPPAQAAQPAQRAPLPLIYANDVRPALDASDFVEGLLTEMALSVTYGPSNCGKTFFMSDLALHVATGRPWRGRAIEAGGVIYCALEGSHGISNRVAAWIREQGLEGVEIPFAIIPVAMNLLDPNADRRRLADTIGHAAAEMGVPVKLVVIDTLSRAMAGGNENAPDDMGALVNSADFIREKCKAHIAFIHHSGKDQAQGARGHSLLRAATDTEIEISRADSASPSVAKVTKQREMEIEGTFGFTLRVVELGANRRGKPVTSCVVEPTDSSAGGSNACKPKLPASAQVALDALSNALSDVGKVRAAAHGVPPNTATVTEAEWRAEFYATTPDTGNANTRRMAFSRAVERLKAERRAGLSSGLAWIIR